jgi:Flp pilus assembly protein TadD
MRSADRWARRTGLVLLIVGLAGCTTFKSSMERLGFQGGDPASAGVAAAKAPAGKASGAAADAAPLPPVDPGVQQAFDRAGQALRGGRIEEAERMYRALAQSQPELAGPHAGLGVIHRHAGRLPEAVAEFEQATKLSPRQPVYWNQLGVTYRLQGKFEKARDAYEQALALDPGYASAVLNLGILYDLYLGDAKRALELYDRYLALSPSGDTAVAKWVADLKNRKPAPITVSRKEQP